jgi:hypothetical protein
VSLPPSPLAAHRSDVWLSCKNFRSKTKRAQSLLIFNINTRNSCKKLSVTLAILCFCHKMSSFLVVSNEKLNVELVQRSLKNASLVAWGSKRWVQMHSPLTTYKLPHCSLVGACHTHFLLNRA